MSTLATFGSGQVLLSMFWFFLFFIWIWLLIAVFSDIIRSDDLGGWGKALWMIFIIVAVYLGVLVYFIARGHGMQERGLKQMRNQEAAQRAYIQTVATSASPAEEIAKAAELRDKGAITEEEFQAIKAKALG